MVSGAMNWLRPSTRRMSVLTSYHSSRTRNSSRNTKWTVRQKSLRDTRHSSVQENENEKWALPLCIPQSKNCVRAGNRIHTARKEEGEVWRRKTHGKKSLWDLIVFKSKTSLEPLDVYLAYAQRWIIEVLFNQYKNIMERDTVNVHWDYRLYATEFINFLSTIISCRVKNQFVKKGISKRHSYKQVFKYLSKNKKVRVSDKSSWKSCTMPKYIAELINDLDCTVD